MNMKFRLARCQREEYGFNMRISLSSDYNRHYDIKASLADMNWQQRFDESKKQIGVFFLLAVFSIFIPVFHFVLVPLFMGLTLWTLWKTKAPRQKMHMEASLNCLQCAKPLPSRFSIEEDGHFSCPHCSATYTLSL